MPVTGNPLAEIDAALARAATRLHAARARADTLTIQRLTAWIDYRLDQRPGLEYHGRELRLTTSGRPPPAVSRPGHHP